MAPDLFPPSGSQDDPNQNVMKKPISDHAKNMHKRLAELAAQQVCEIRVKFFFALPVHPVLEIASTSKAVPSSYKSSDLVAQRIAHRLKLVAIAQQTIRN